MGKTGAMKLIVSFVERGQGNDLAKYYAEHNVNFNFRSVGIGTASSDLLDVLGDCFGVQWCAIQQKVHYFRSATSYHIAEWDSGAFLCDSRQRVT